MNIDLHYLYQMNLFLRFLLAPFAIFYYLIILMRNKMFDIGLLKSENYTIPIISVGNISTGGTGKTPHTEYIINLLLSEFGDSQFAVLSRGYKRKTRGFLIVDNSHTHNDAGDEPCQYKKHFSNHNVIVAVDAKRRRGIRKLMQTYPDLKAIILDDAYQHRYVKPGLNILLTDFYKPLYRDRLLPFGNLREPRKSSKRADLIIITKSPPVISPIVRRDILQRLKPNREQKLFFSKIVYGNLTEINKDNQIVTKPLFSTIFLLTGIANPYPLEEHLKSISLQIETFHFADHHSYSDYDIKKILYNFDAHLSTNKIIVTTEKDTMRLQSNEILKLISDYPVFYVPIKVEPDKNDKNELHQIITEYVRKN